MTVDDLLNHTRRIHELEEELARERALLSNLLLASVHPRSTTRKSSKTVANKVLREVSKGTTKRGKRMSDEKLRKLVLDRVKGVGRQQAITAYAISKESGVSYERVSKMLGNLKELSSTTNGRGHTVYWER